MFATIYWVGGAGNWSDTAHWSASSGGSGGHAVPTQSDNAVIDENSFSGAGVVTVDAVAGICNDFSLDNSNGVGLTFGTNKKLSVFGNVHFDGLGAVNALNGTFELRGLTGTCLVDLNDVPYQGDFSLGLNQTTSHTRIWQLQSNATGFNMNNSNFTVYGGVFDANDFNISGRAFGQEFGELMMGNGTFQFNGFDIGVNGGSEVTVTPEGSSLAIIDNGGSPYGISINHTQLLRKRFNIVAIQAVNGEIVTLGDDSASFDAADLTIEGEAGAVAQFVSGKTYTFDSFTANNVKLVGDNFTTGKAVISSSLVNLNFVSAKGMKGTGSASPFNVNGGIDFGFNEGFTGFGTLPAYVTSLVSALARVQQGLAFPKWIMGGLDEGGNHALFANLGQYTFSVFRSEVFHEGQPFDVMSIVIPFGVPLDDDSMLITPVLHFDVGPNGNGRRTSAGKSITTLNFPDGPNFVVLTPDCFPDGTHGDTNWFLELQHRGSVLLPVCLPIVTDVEPSPAI